MTAKDNIFSNSEISFALFAWNSFLIQENKKNLPKTPSQLYHNRITALNRYRATDGLSTIYLVQAFYELHPEWNCGSIEDFFKRMISTKEFLEPVKCINHPNKKAVYNNMCYACSYALLKNTFLTPQQENIKYAEAH